MGVDSIITTLMDRLGIDSRDAPEAGYLEGLDLEPEDDFGFTWSRLIAESPVGRLLLESQLGQAVPRRPVSEWTKAEWKQVLQAAPLGSLTPSETSQMLDREDFTPLQDIHRGADQRRLTQDDVMARLTPNAKAIALMQEKFGAITDFVDILVDEETGEVTITAKNHDPEKRGEFSWPAKGSVYADTYGLQAIVRELDPTSAEDIDAFYYLVSLWGARTIYHMRGKHIIQGLNQLDPDQNYVFAPTHAGNVEFSLLYMMSNIAGGRNRTGFILKEQFKKFPLNIILGKAAETFLEEICCFIDRSNAARNRETVADMAGRLSRPNHPYSVVLYPHGSRADKHLDEMGRRVDGRLGLVHTGIYHLARQAGIPVVGITMNGMGETDTRNISSRAQLGLVTRTLITKPMSVPQDLSNGGNRVDRDALTNHLEQVYGTYWSTPMRSQAEMQALRTAHARSKMSTSQKLALQSRSAMAAGNRHLASGAQAMRARAARMPSPVQSARHMVRRFGPK
jgi:1-acyl-sn-glycerol-3-phosphate acyltransferase